MQTLSRRTLLLGGLGLSLATIGCDTSSSSSGRAPRKTSTTKILIGHYGAITGSQATFGTSTDNGIKLAVDEMNAAGGINGKKVLLVTHDDKSETKEVGPVVTRLITLDNVHAVIGEVASGRSLVGAPICQEHQVPMISPSSTNERVTEIGDMISRVCFIDEFQGRVCAKFARENDRIKADTAAIFYDQSSPYSVGLMKVFEKSFTEFGGKVVTKQTYKEGDQDFSAQLTSIRAAKPDVIFVPGYYTEVGTIAKQARRLDITVPLLGGDGWDSEQLAKIGGDAINGSFYSNHYSHQDPSEAVQGFIKKYKKQFNAVPDGLAALGYDAANLLFAAMKRAPSLEGPVLAKAISETKNFQGVTGNISIDEHRNAIKPAVMLEMKDGEPTFVATIQPE